MQAAGDCPQLLQRFAGEFGQVLLHEALVGLEQQLRFVGRLRRGAGRFVIGHRFLANSVIIMQRVLHLDCL